eukprot:458345-Prorocentrum_minimum.AAC.1
MRNRKRREEAGAYFASPDDAPKADGPFSSPLKKPKAVGPFGLDLELDEFEKPEGWDEMSGSLTRSHALVVRAPLRLIINIVEDSVMSR